MHGEEVDNVDSVESAGDEIEVTAAESGQEESHVLALTLILHSQ